MKEVNLLNLPGKRARQTNVRAAVMNNEKKGRKGRPSITYNRKQVTNTSLRFLDGGM